MMVLIYSTDAPPTCFEHVIVYFTTLFQQEMSLRSYNGRHADHVFRMMVACMESDVSEEITQTKYLVTFLDYPAGTPDLSNLQA
jgi:hypothetical protein